MKVKQKSIRVFEVECGEIAEFAAYLDKNSVLLEGFLLLLKGGNDDFAKECKKKNLCFALMGECADGALSFKKDVVLPQAEEPKKESKETPAPQKTEEPKAEVQKKQPIKPQAKLPLDAKTEEPKQVASLTVRSKTMVITKPLRSGEDIDTDADVTITGRINSGAKVKTTANATLLDIVDGDVEAWGDYVMLKNIGKGTVSLKGAKVDKNALNGKMKLVTFDGKLSMKDI